MRWIAEGLIHRGWRVHLYGPKFPFSLHSTNLPKIFFKEQPWMHQSFINTWRFLRFIRVELPSFYKTLAASINKQGFDAVLVFSDWMIGAPSLLRFLNDKKIFVVFEPKREYTERTFWSVWRDAPKILFWREITKFIYREDRENALAADAFFTISRFAQRALSEYYTLPLEKISWHYPGVPLKYFLKANVTSCMKGRYFTSMGAFTFLKGYKFILEALSHSDYKMFKLHLIGNGGYHKDILRRFAKERKVDLFLSENIRYDMLYKILKQSYLFLYFPRNEPFGLSLLEAVLARTYPLVINNGGPDEVASKLDFPRCPRQPAMFNICLHDAVQKYDYLCDKRVFKDILERIRLYFSLERYLLALERLISQG